MTPTTIMSVDQLCSKYNLKRNIITFELRRLRGEGVPEEQYLLFLQLQAEGVTKFSREEFSIKLAPKEAVFYDKYFFLSLKDLCREYGIQQSLVKQFYKNGATSLESAITKAKQKVEAQKRKQQQVEQRKTTKEELDFLNLSPEVRTIVEKHNLDAKALIYEAAKNNVSLEQYVVQLEKQILSTEIDVSTLDPSITTTISVEKGNRTNKDTQKTVIKALGGKDSPYNANTISNDATSLRLSIPDFVNALQQFNMLPLYLKEGKQPTFTFKGKVYPNFEAFVQTHGLQIIEVRLLIFQAQGDIEKALAHAFRTKQKAGGRTGNQVVYRGKKYESYRALSNAFNLPYDTLVKNIKVCFLPNAPRTVDEVVDEIIYNMNNNYITVNGNRILLQVGRRKYKNVTELCRVEGVSSTKLNKLLKQGYALEQAIQHAK